MGCGIGGRAREGGREGRKDGGAEKEEICFVELKSVCLSLSLIGNHACLDTIL